jgi:co-chaperonin GroES (HSP10)
MAKDSLARGAASAQFSGGQAKKDDPIEFHGTVAAQEPELISDANGNHPNQKDWQLSDPLAHSKYLDHCYIIGTRVLIRKVVEAEGTIVQPDAFKRDTPKGIVVQTPEYPWLKGRTILFNEYCAEEVKLDAEDLLLVDYNDIRVVLPQ